MPDPDVAVLDGLDPTGRRAVLRLVQRATRARGTPPLGDPALAEVAGRTPGGTSVSLLATRGDAAGPVGYGHLDPPARRTSGSTPGRTDGGPEHDEAQGTWTVAVAVDPAGEGADGAGSEVASALLEVAVAETRRRGGTALRWWCPGATEDDGLLAAAHGFDLERTLLQLRCALPLADDGRTTPVVTTRAFRPGQDEDAWLRTNNRAFAGHPEQGAWDRSTVLAREREPWFDADGFRILEEGGVVSGFCWTKIHADAVPQLGEIYVIGVDPAAHGRGLGRALARDGLAWLADRGISTGMLYVDGANETALRLYRSLGFTEHHRDRAYVATVSGPSQPPESS